MTVRSCRRCGCTDDDCSGCIARTGEPCRWVAEDLCSACSPVTIPEEITPAMREVLGMPNFRSAPIAHLFRAAGHDIKSRLEDEQAFLHHRFLPLAILHGDGWWDWATRDIEAAVAKIKTNTADALDKGTNAS